MKKVIRLTESELTRIIKRVISESEPKLKSTNRDNVHKLQWYILNYELEKDIAKYKYEPLGCKMPVYEKISRMVYKPGVPNQCKIEGSLLCEAGTACYTNQMLDGVYGPLTKAAYTKYKDVKGLSEIDEYKDKTLEEIFGSFNYVAITNPRLNRWNFPAGYEEIKGFQTWVYKVKEKNQPKSTLCGEIACDENQAIDGSWGKNTKIAWNKYKQEYFDAGYGVGTIPEKIRIT